MRGGKRWLAGIRLIKKANGKLRLAAQG